MFNGNNLEQLQKMARESSKKLNLELRIFDETLAESIRKAPEEEKQAIEGLRSMCQKSISLAKQGKSEEANQIIKDYQNGRKSNR